MKTEARKAYEKQMPRWEMVLRDRLWGERRELKVQKVALQVCLMSDSCNNREREKVYKDHVKLLRAAIKAQKHLIQILKNGLPQRRPDGVMARCPFCGRRTVICSHLRNGCGEAVYQTVCTWCGGRARMKEDKQDAIDAWNRRA